VAGSAVLLALLAGPPAAAQHPAEHPPAPVGHAAGPAGAALDDALDRLVALPGGPPGVIAVVQRGSQAQVHSAGVAGRDATRPPAATDHMHIASVAKAFSGAVALGLVDTGVLGLDDTVGRWRPELPAAWHGVTLRQLLGHTSGVPDFVTSPAAQEAIAASPGLAPPPERLLDLVADERLAFPPGTRYAYSNSDNIIVGLVVEAATGRPYEESLHERVVEPLGLGSTSLPRGPELPEPSLRGYALDPDTGAEDDVSEVLAGGWAWAAGGIVATPADLNRFVRGYVGATLFGAAVQDEQFEFTEGGSEPTGPGTNAAGLALFRYRTGCGTVYGHTGNTLGYTQFAAASRDGDRSVTMSMTLQRTQADTGPAGEVFRALREAQELAVCAALAEG
jgi:D-alanyl-D-alanine carboxypeptidase